MKAQKNHLITIIIGLLAGFMVTSCSSVGDIPKDDVYYAKGTNNPSQYNWDDFEKNADTYGTRTVKTNTSSSSGDSFDYSSNYQENVGAKGSSDSEYDYVDDYYDESYESRINRFGSNSNNSGFGYYDGYNTGNCNCGSNSNFSIGFGMSSGYGMGYGGWGWQMGYGYGWPNYYYPSYYYDPFYGYNSYMNGYWAGYNAGYWNGYYGGYYPPYGGYYPPYGGYYPEYGYNPAVAYGPRHSGVTGSTIPRNRDGGGSTGSTLASGTVNSGDDRMVSGGAYNRGGNAVGTSSGQSVSSSNGQGATGRTVKLGKPDGNEITGVQEAARTRTVKKGEREMVYQKPKAYRNLSNQNNAGNRSEYVRPTNKTIVGTNDQNGKRVIRTNPTTTRSMNNSGERKGNIYKPSGNRSTLGTSTTRKSYSSPSRSNSSSRSYSSPSTTTRSTGTRSSGISSGGGSRSYNNSSSSGSSRSTGSSRSSGSSSGGGGFSPKRR